MRYGHWVISIAVVIALVLVSGCATTSFGNQQAGSNVTLQPAATVPGTPHASGGADPENRNQSTRPSITIETTVVVAATQDSTLMEGDWVEILDDYHVLRSFQSHGNSTTCIPIAGIAYNIYLQSSTGNTLITQSTTNAKGELSFTVPNLKTTTTSKTGNFTFVFLPAASTSSKPITVVEKISAGPTYLYTFCKTASTRTLEPRTMGGTEGDKSEAF